MLSVVAQGSNPLLYQWYFNAAAGIAATNATSVVGHPTNALAGATNAMLVLRNVTAAQAGYYAVTVGNPYGSVIGGPALLSVVAAPVIVSEPSDVTVTNGGTAQFSVTAQGMSPLFYQWYVNGSNALAGATNTTLILSNVVPSQAAGYSVSVGNAYGSVRSADAVLTVLSGTVIVSGPSDETVTNGQTAKLSVVAQGSNPLIYQWYFNAAAGVAATNVTSVVGHPTNALAGATNAMLVLSNVTVAQAGYYAVTVGNPYGSAIGGPALLSVVAAPVIVSGPSDVTVTNGGTAQFSVTAQGMSPLFYQWYVNGSNALAGATNTTLILSNVVPSQAAGYSVSVSNAYGSVRSAEAVLTVLSGPIIVSGPSGQTVTNGQTAMLSVVAQGSNPLLYQWYFNAAAGIAATNATSVVGHPTNALAGATNAMLVLRNVTAAQAGYYAVTVSNPYGSAIGGTGIVKRGGGAIDCERTVGCDCDQWRNGPIQCDRPGDESSVLSMVCEREQCAGGSDQHDPF